MYIPNAETYGIVLFVLIASVICLGALIIIFLYSLIFKKKNTEAFPGQDGPTTNINDELNFS